MHAYYLSSNMSTVAICLYIWTYIYIRDNMTAHVFLTEAPSRPKVISYECHVPVRAFAISGLFPVTLFIVVSVCLSLSVSLSLSLSLSLALSVILSPYLTLHVYVNYLSLALSISISLSLYLYIYIHIIYTYVL